MYMEISTAPIEPNMMRQMAAMEMSMSRMP